MEILFFQQLTGLLQLPLLMINYQLNLVIYSMMLSFLDWFWFPPGVTMFWIWLSLVVHLAPHNIVCVCVCVWVCCCVCVCENLPDTDYDEVLFTLSILPPQQCQTHHCLYNYKKADFCKFCETLSSIPWEMAKSDDINSRWESWNDLFYCC